jgi:hypothetical protein
MALNILSFELKRDPNHGRLLELRLYEEMIINCPSILNILHETQLRRLYGWHACSVDFLIEFQDGIVLVQCKYRNTRRRETNSVANFLKSVEVIKASFGKPFLFGMWISRLAPFDDNIEQLVGKNIKVVYTKALEDLTNDAVLALIHEIRM